LEGSGYKESTPTGISRFPASSSLSPLRCAQNKDFKHQIFIAAADRNTRQFEPAVQN
jgi:hypothetical protein